MGQREGEGGNDGERKRGRAWRRQARGEEGRARELAERGRERREDKEDGKVTRDDGGGATGLEDKKR